MNNNNNSKLSESMEKWILIAFLLGRKEVVRNSSFQYVLEKSMKEVFFQ